MTDYAEKAAMYWVTSDGAYAVGDPGLGDELAELAAQCDTWAHEDRTGVHGTVG
ncbi:hypothetical protein [Gordonia rhizosphera]|uniref:Uncharacterized protein n=1 Tax=Gordonia rhizosphera NBRC 16068 TaxID=1108045 RepID=K6W5V2_9ACTN|nr:hypothetical protein [Gordonia rhizosphera]GAB89081.1 hypothetical protein GORHZ_049_00140 [Gordonia rhizosphera NBRC 16068]